jgi:hypothetical protein
MPWRFRKRKKLFPGMTLNVTDKSIGVTVGNRGGRVSVNSSGRQTVGASVPGTGVYYQKTISSGKRGAPTTTPAAGGGCLRKVLVWGGGLLAVLFGVSVLASLAPRSTPTEERAGNVVITVAPLVIEATASVAPTATMAPAVVDATVAPSATPVPTATPAPIDMPTATPVPIDMPPAIPTVAAEPPAIPTVAAEPVVIEAANVRDGPGVQYAVMSGAQPGQPVVVTGRDASGEWLQLGNGYWIAAALVANAPVDLPVTAPAQLPAGNPTAAPLVVDATPANVFTCIGGCATPPDSSCAIKGNVNSKGELIYHAPGWRDYERTDVKPEEGDRWFCTEDEAQAAGFRAPENH